MKKISYLIIILCFIHDIDSNYINLYSHTLLDINFTFN